uniref:Uncharacterized protein n=1 Tax=Aegilops tauschii subsp. strangulata TaxID=200361 RepID=A0A453ENA1_AEGTS
MQLTFIMSMSLLFSPCLLTSVGVLKSNGVFFGFLSYPVLVGMFSVVAWLLQDVCVPLFICPLFICPLFIREVAGDGSILEGWRLRLRLSSKEQA